MARTSIAGTSIGSGTGWGSAIAYGAVIAGLGLAAAPARAGEDAGSPITIETPAEGSFSAKREVEVRGSVSGSSLTSVVVNGNDVPVRDGRFHVWVEAKSEGEFELRVMYGAVGKPAAVVARTVHIDGTSPSLSVLHPRSSEGVFPGAEGMIRGRASDPNLARVEMNGVAVTLGRDGAFAVPFVLPAVGNLTVEIAAIDRAGNRRAESRVLRRATKADEDRRPAYPTDPPVPPRPAAKPSPTRPQSATDVTARAVDDALGWLAAHQSPDGGFEADGFGSWCDRERFETAGADQPDAQGRGKANYDVGVTGFAVLAFLGAGYTNRSEGPYGKVVGDALRYLRNVQDAEGCFGNRSTGHYLYNHGIAALAMIEAYERSESTVYRSAAQKALDFIAIARNPYFAWRYGIKPGDNDTSMTGWMIQSLIAARRVNRAAAAAVKAAPFEFDAEGLAGATQWIEKMTDPDTGRVGYQQRGTGPARTSELMDKFPADRSESMTAIGVYVRLRVPGPDADAGVAISGPARLGLQLMERLPPVWNPEDGSIDAYYWYYGSLACHAAGGATWENWRSALLKALLPAQRQDGDACTTKGSFDPIDPWGTDGGRVYMTAIATLCLETSDRDEPPLSK